MLVLVAFDGLSPERLDWQNQIGVIFETRAGYQSAIRMRVAWKVVPGA
jgi:hypothetical protein